MNQMVKRIIMSVLGVVICGISVGMFKFAALGIDPFQSLMSGLDAVIPIRFGTLYIIVNVVLLLFALIFDRKKIGIATFINLFLLGYIVEFSQGLCERLMPDAPLWLRVVILLIAIVILCLSSALYFTADLGVSTYDAVALVWSQKQSKLRFAFCRVICDFVCVAIGVALLLFSGQSITEIFGSVGVGTIITAFFMGPLIMSSLQGDSLAASFASSCEKYPRKSLSTFYLRLVSKGCVPNDTQPYFLIWNYLDLDAEALLDRPLLAQHQNGFVARQNGFGRDGEIHLAVFFDAQNIDTEFFAHIHFCDALADPILGHRHLINRMVVVELEIVEHMLGAVADRRPLRYLLFGNDDLVRTVAQQKLCLHVAVGTRHDHFSAQLFEKRGGFERALKITADGDDAHVIIIDSQRTEKRLIGAVADLRIGDDRQDRIDTILVLVDSHNLVPMLAELVCQQRTKAVDAD